MSERRRLTPRMEQYLEVIGQLERDTEVVRVRDIASRMDVKMPSVTSALRSLASENLVRHGRYEHVRLTEEGRAAAQRVQRRHDVLLEFLTDVLGIPSETAEKDACDMEHFVSSLTLERLVQFIEFIKTCPRGSEDSLTGFRHYLKYGERPAVCLSQGERGDAETREMREEGGAS